MAATPNPGTMTQESEVPTTAAELAGDADAGPVLLLRGCTEGRLWLRALVVRPQSASAETLSADGKEAEARRLLRLDDLQVLAYDFALPLGSQADYHVAGRSYTVKPTGKAISGSPTPPATARRAATGSACWRSATFCGAASCASTRGPPPTCCCKAATRSTPMKW